ncbi:MAG: hypothetical protein KME26_07890 [Oscillatoria princeps RMCB-10]|jgi:hypothetical protein|nr:hypothetical protein [Oscillatoria princeps RMCB-10]
MVNPEADCGKTSNEAGADNLSFLEKTNRLIEFLRNAEDADLDEVDENKKTERVKEKLLQSFQVIHQELSELQKTQPDSNFLGTFNAIMECAPPHTHKSDKLF